MPGAFFVCLLSSEPCNTWLLQGECSGFDGFQEQMTESQVELTIDMFTKLLLDYIQCYLQYLHIAVVNLMYCMLYFTTLT